MQNAWLAQRLQRHETTANTPLPRTLRDIEHQVLHLLRWWTGRSDSPWTECNAAARIYQLTTAGHGYGRTHTRETVAQQPTTSSGHSPRRIVKRNDHWGYSHNLHNRFILASLSLIKSARVTVWEGSNNHRFDICIGALHLMMTAALSFATTIIVLKIGESQYRK